MKVMQNTRITDVSSKKSMLSKIIRINVIVLIVLALSSAALIYAVYDDVMHGDISIKDQPKLPDISFGGDENDDPDDDIVEPGVYRYNVDLVNILLVGVDTGLGRTNNNGYNSDVLIIVSVDQKTGKVTCLSIPRDTQATFNKYNQRTLEVSGEITTKINNAFAQGGGPKKKSYLNARDAVSKLMTVTAGNGEKISIPIHYHVGVNMDGIRSVVDAIGGVKMTMSYDFTYYNSSMKKGATLNLNGNDALEYIRQRSHIPNSGGDIERTQRQREFIVAAANKIKTMGAYQTATKLFDPLTKYVDTDISLQNCLKLARLLDDVNLDGIQMEVLPGKPANNGDYICDHAKKEELILKFYYKVC